MAKIINSELVLEIIKLAIQVNSETNYCVFVDYYGHIGSIDARVSKSKTDYNNILKHWHCTSNDQGLEEIAYYLMELLEGGR